MRASLPLGCEPLLTVLSVVQVVQKDHGWWCLHCLVRAYRYMRDAEQCANAKVAPLLRLPCVQHFADFARLPMFEG